MRNKLILALMVLGVLIAGGLLFARPISANSPALAQSPQARNQQASQRNELAAVTAAAAYTTAYLSFSNIGHQAVGTLSVLGDFFRLETAGGFLIGALLLVIATSLRLRVIRKIERDPELQS